MKVGHLRLPSCNVGYFMPKDAIHTNVWILDKVLDCPSRHDAMKKMPTNAFGFWAHSDDNSGTKRYYVGTLLTDSQILEQCPDMMEYKKFPEHIGVVMTTDGAHFLQLGDTIIRPFN